MTQAIMQQCLGEQWHKLPKVLQQHYQYRSSSNLEERGLLNIEFPTYTRPLWIIMGWFGILLNRNGQQCPTTVNRSYRGNTEIWHREIRFDDDNTTSFDSFVEYAGANEQIEFVNPLLGLKMAVEIQDQQLIYTGKSYVLRLGKWQLNIPNWLALGNSTIVETPVGDEQYRMDYRLEHPLFGELFRYHGVFGIARV